MFFLLQRRSAPRAKKKLASVPISTDTKPIPILLESLLAPSSTKSTVLSPHLFSCVLSICVYGFSGIEKVVVSKCAQYQGLAPGYIRGSCDPTRQHRAMETHRNLPGFNVIYPLAQYPRIVLAAVFTFLRPPDLRSEPLRVHPCPSATRNFF